MARDIGGGFTDWWASGMLGELACLSLKAARVDEAETHAREALALADQLHDRAGRIFGVGVLAAIAATRGQVVLAARLWTAIEHEDAVAPLGGWRRHRQECEAVIQQSRRPGAARPSRAGESWTLEDAVHRALDDVDQRQHGPGRS
jgi:hypothetical protein